MSTSELYLRTGYVLNSARQIISTREPHARPRPLFTVVRGFDSVVRAVHADVPASLTEEVEQLAETECPAADLRAQPRHAWRYRSLLGGYVRSGAAFVFPDQLEPSNRPVLVDRLEPLERYFDGWTSDEIAGRTPIAVMLEGADAVSVCCSS